MKGQVRQKIVKILIATTLLLTVFAALGQNSYARTDTTDASVAAFIFTSAATSIQPPSTSGTVTVNTQTGEVDVSLHGFSPSIQLQLAFVGLANLVLGPVNVDMPGAGRSSF